MNVTIINKSFTSMLLIYSSNTDTISGACGLIRVSG